MGATVSSPGCVNGMVALPGDHALTLATLALGMLGGSTVSVMYPASSPAVARLLRLIRARGGEYREDVDGFTFRGGNFSEIVTIPADIPESVFHILIAAAVFSAERVILENPNGIRDALFAELLPVFRVFGLRDSAVSVEDGRVAIEGARAVAPEGFSVRSAWEMETVAAIRLVGGVSPVFSCNRQEVSHVLTLLGKLGLKVANAEGQEAKTDALTRRMARFSGEKPQEWLRFEGEPAECEVRIPGDTFLAGAVATLAAVLPHSDVTLRGVLWEPGRRGFLDTLRRMRGTVEWEPRRGYSFDAADIRVTGGVLEGVRTSPAQARTMRSELMLLAVAAAFARGETIVRDSAPGNPFGRDVFRFLSDGLRVLGAHAGDYEDGVVVKGGFELRGGSPDSGGHAEVAAALAVAGMLSSGRTTVAGCDSLSWPLDALIRIVEPLSGKEGKEKSFSLFLLDSEGDIP